MKTDKRRGPLLAAGFLLGAGLGGSADGILFHQIMQTHQMLSGWLPPSNLLDIKVNQFIDGLFHLFTWTLTLLGVALLYAAGRGPQRWWSGRSLLGAGLLGWGLFNVLEGLVNHHMLGLHHVIDQAPDPRIPDAIYLGVGLLMMGLGLLLIRRAGRPLPADAR